MIKILFSGSKGNCILIEYNGVNYFFDLGVSLAKLKAKLGDELLRRKSNIFISHVHSDHINGVLQFEKKYECNIYGKQLGSKICKSYIEVDEVMMIDDMRIEFINLSHDADNTLGFIINIDKYKIVLVTDTGYISNENIKKMNNPDVLLLEANHDVEMLMTGSYHWNLKNRVMGDYGHLSNEQFKNYFKQIKGSNTKFVVALHLSEENNDENVVKNLLSEYNEIVNCVATRNGLEKSISLDWK